MKAPWGPTTGAWLAEQGILDLEALQAQEPLTLWLAIKVRHPQGASLNLLWCLLALHRFGQAHPLPEELKAPWRVRAQAAWAELQAQPSTSAR